MYRVHPGQYLAAGSLLSVPETKLQLTMAGTTVEVEEAVLRFRGRERKVKKTSNCRSPETTQLFLHKAHNGYDEQGIYA